MKNILFLLLFLFVFGSCQNDQANINQNSSLIENVPGTYNKTIDISGDKRQYVVYVPQSVKGLTKVPVLFMIHGTNQTGLYHYNTNLWNTKAEQEGFIVVYPTALIYCHFDSGEQRTVTKWNSGDLGETNINLGALPLCSGEVLKDDVVFFDSLIVNIKRNFVINEKRIYASGFSNGAQMTARLAAQRSEVFASVAIHAGNLSNFIPTNLSSRPMSMIITVGNKDYLFTEGAGIKNPAPIDSTLMTYSGVTTMLQRFLDISGLSNQFSFKSTTSLGQFDYNKSLVGKNNNIRFIIIQNLAHNYTSILIDDYWNFLSSHSLP